MMSGAGVPGEPARQLDPALEEFARTEIARQLGRGTVSHIDVVQVEGQHAVLMITIGSSSRLVLKVAGRDDHRAAIDYERTAAVTALARAAGAPVAEVLAVDTSCSAGPWRYLLLEHVEGVEWRRVRPLLDNDGLRAAHRQIAEALLTIQSVRLRAFGDLPSQATPSDVSLVSALRRRAELLITDERPRGSFLELLDRDADLFVVPDQQPTLTHDDLHHGNLIFRRTGDSWQLAGILDWDKAWAGPAESDVARMTFWDDMTGPGFWEVYRGAVPVTDGYPERMLIYQLLWCLEYDASSARHLNDANTLRRQLGLAPLDGS